VAPGIVDGRHARGHGVIRDYLELSKSRIVMMVLMTTAAGYVVGARQFDWVVLLNVLIGTALVAAGTNALNQYAERHLDVRMNRTSRRPLPAGRITPRAALVFSSGIAVIGTAYLALMVNPLAALLGAFTLTSYIFVYTPLKRISTACTVIGAIPGAVPPLMGYAAATGTLDVAGWILFGVVFLWQLPHFMAISWIYREDYGRAGFKMLSVKDAEGSAVARQAIFYSLALIPVAVAPAFLHMAGMGYGVVAAIASAALLVWSIRFLLERTPRRARALFMTSNFYLLVMTVLFVGLVRG
jgi:heme o synthase